MVINHKQNSMDPNHKQRLTEYAFTHEVPDDSDYYAKESTYNSNRCVLCGAVALNSYSYEEIPQGKFNLIAEKVRVCHNCSVDVADIRNALPHRVKPTIKLDTCKGCKEVYTINAEEHTARNKEGTFGEYFCDSCILNEYPELVGTPRFMFVVCSTQGCNEETYYDRAKMPDNSKIKCSRCKNLSGYGEAEEYTLKEGVILWTKWVSISVFEAHIIIEDGDDRVPIISKTGAIKSDVIYLAIEEAKEQHVI